MPEATIKNLKEAIRSLHGCDSTWVESVPVKEMFQGKIVWEGNVHVFDLRGCPTATRCYAWSHETTGEKRKFVTVLHQGKVNSPLAAVRAAIVQESRKADT